MINFNIFLFIFVFNCTWNLRETFLLLRKNFVWIIVTEKTTEDRFHELNDFFPQEWKGSFNILVLYMEKFQICKSYCKRVFIKLVASLKIWHFELKIAVCPTERQLTMSKRYFLTNKLFSGSHILLNKRKCRVGA